MFVIEVIPLKRGVKIESLSYFSSEPYALGTILSIPVRQKAVRGVVAGITEASKSKTALRAATFSLRKLPPQKDAVTLSSQLMETAARLADIYACQQGAVIYQLLPPEVREGVIPLPPHHTLKHPTSAAKAPHAPEVLQGTTAERYRAYRSIVREAFAHAASTLIVVPSSIDAHEIEAALTSGIEDRMVLLTSSMTAKALAKNYQLLGDFAKPKLIIATPGHSVVERHDITTTIMENSRSGNYIERTRPYLDYRTVLKTHAHHTGRRLILGDLFPRTEEEVLRREERYGTYDEMPKRLMLPGKLTIVQMKDKPDGTTPFELFAPRVLKEIEQTRTAKGRTFLFAARRGLAPVVACADCGHIFRSPESGAPYSLVRTRKDGVEERWFVCGVSGQRVRAADTCPSCSSWRLRERGIGIQHVHDELHKKLPDVPLIMFDYTSASTLKKALFLQETFYGTKGAVMLGTQMALSYLREPVHTSVVVNMDALRATPTWRQQEETLATLLRLREVTSGNVLVQTRQESDELLEFAKMGTLERFYDGEIELRKQFNYPPFARFIHLTWQGSKETTDEMKEHIATLLEVYKPTFYKAPPTQNGSLIQYALVRFPEAEWPSAKLGALLRQLHPAIRLVHNPDRIV